MKRTCMSSFALVLILAMAGLTHAATISYVGSLNDVSDNAASDIAGWRSSDLDKPANLDPNGDEAFGSDGWYLQRNASGTATTDEFSVPAYIQSITQNGLSTYANASSHIDMDDPDLALAANVTDGEFGVFYTKDNDNPDRRDKFFTITLASQASFLLGIIQDGYPVTAQQNSLIEVQNPSGTISATATPETNNEETDFHFFQIDGSTGDQFEIYLTGTDNQNGFINTTGLTFEIIPEPATLALLGLGGAVMLAGRKRS